MARQTSKRPKPVKTKVKRVTPEAEAKTEATEPEATAATECGNGKSEQDSMSVVAHDSKQRLTREELFRIELFYTKVELEVMKAQYCELQAQKMEHEAVLQVRALRADAALHQTEADKFKSSGQAFMLSLGPKYGVDFSKCAYDDESGAITELEPSDKVKRDTTA